MKPRIKEHMIKDRQKRSGQILILTAFFVFLLFTLALSFFKLVPVELNSALRAKHAVLGRVAAESGIQEARAWLESQPQQVVLTQQDLDNKFNSEAATEPIVLDGDWTYQVNITLNPNASFTFDVVSVAFFDGNPVRESRATIARENFSHYALFIDRWGDNLVMEAYPETVRGPFHTNDFFKLFVPPGMYGNPGAQPFVSGDRGRMTQAGGAPDGSVGFAGDGNEYYSASSAVPNSSESVVPYNADGAIESRYAALVNGGRSNMTVTEHIDLPYSADELMFDAMDSGEGNPPFNPPAEIGVYLPGSDTEVTGGIYIRGAVDIDLQVTPEGNQVHNLTQAIPQYAYRLETEAVRSVPVFEFYDYQLQVGDSVQVYTTQTVTVTEQQVTGYEDQVVTETVQRPTGNSVYVSAGGGSVGSYQAEYVTETVTTTVQVPVYESVEVERTVQVPTTVTVQAGDPQVGQTVRRRRQNGTRDETYTDVQIISTEDYEANPANYPGAFRVSQSPETKNAKIIEVTADAGYNGDLGSAVKGETLIKDYDGTITKKSGNLNGVTFVDGDVTSIKGTHKGALGVDQNGNEKFQGRYLVSNPKHTGRLTVTDDILAFYDGDNPQLQGANQTLKVGELSPTAEHALGIVAKDISLKPAQNDPLDIYAVLLGGRSIPGEDPDARPEVEGGFGADPSVIAAGYVPTQNKFSLYGGLVQGNQRQWALGGVGLSGELIFDPAVAGDMPRFPRSSEVVTLRYADRHVSSI